MRAPVTQHSLYPLQGLDVEWYSIAKTVCNNCVMEKMVFVIAVI